MTTILKDAEVVRLLEPRAIADSVEAAFRQLGAGLARQPSQLQVVLPVDAGDVIHYAGVTTTPALIGITSTPFLMSRLSRGQSPVTAYTMVISGDTGELVGVLESKSLIAARTGAATWIAARRLVSRLDRVAIIGSGQVAEWHLRQLRDQACSEVAIFSPGLNSADRADRRARMLGLDPRVKFAASARAAVDEAGLVMLCTSSATPVIEVAWTASDAVITSVTTDGVNAHEIDPAAISGMDVFCDFREAAPNIAGEMVIARARFGWSETSIIMDLPELVMSDGMPAKSRDGRRYFRSVGLGIEDVAGAAAVLGTPCRWVDPADSSDAD